MFIFFAYMFVLFMAVNENAAIFEGFMYCYGFNLNKLLTSSWGPLRSQYHQMPLSCYCQLGEE